MVSKNIASNGRLCLLALLYLMRQLLSQYVEKESLHELSNPPFETTSR